MFLALAGSAYLAIEFNWWVVAAITVLVTGTIMAYEALTMEHEDDYEDVPPPYPEYLQGPDVNRKEDSP